MRINFTGAVEAAEGSRYQLQTAITAWRPITDFIQTDLAVQIDCAYVFGSENLEIELSRLEVCQRKRLDLICSLLISFMVDQICRPLYILLSVPLLMSIGAFRPCNSALPVVIPKTRVRGDADIVTLYGRRRKQTAKRSVIQIL